MPTYTPGVTPTCEWDTAAAQAVIEAAGGQLLGPDLKPLRYNRENLVNPDFYAIGDPAFPTGLLIDNECAEDRDTEN